MQMMPPLWQKARGTKEPLDESEREEWKAGLKLNIHKTKIMASGPIKQMEKQWKQCQTLFSWALKSLQMVIAAMKLKDACSLEEKLTNLDSVCRDITLPTKVHLVKAMVFAVVMCGRENWTTKAEC